MPAHTSTLVVPQRSRYGPNHYRKLDGAYSSSSVANSDRSPVYESIGDADSIKERGRGRGASVSECEFCECGGDHSSDQSAYAGYHDPIVLEDHQVRGGICMDKLGHPVVKGYSDSGSSCLTQAQDEPPGPCPPLFMDDYYDDKCPQTLPLRPLRSHSDREDNKSSNYPNIEPDELSPLNRKTSGNQTDSEGDIKSDIRRRPSSGSCYSNGGSNYKEGNLPSQRRVIPALHAHYFVASTEEIS